MPTAEFLEEVKSWKERIRADDSEAETQEFKDWSHEHLQELLHPSPETRAILDD